MSSAAATHKTATRGVTNPRAAQPLPWILAGVVLLALMIVAIYRPALRGGFILDDEDLLQRCGEAGLQKIWFSTTLPDYWPLTQSMLCSEWRAWGSDTLGYHLINVALHFVSTLLLWRILRLLAVPGAFVAALLFAVHPVNVESVAWIAQRKNTLAMLFFLLSANAYLRSETARTARSKLLYPISLLCFLLALLSKASVIILPPILLLLVWWRRTVTKRDVYRVAPFFALATIFTLVNVWFMSHANAEGIRHATLAQRVLGAGAVVWFYIWKTVLPVDLAFIYPQWNIDLKNLVWIVPTVVAVGVTAVLWWRRDKTIGRNLFVAWMFFVIALGPVMGLSDTGFMRFSLVADHYQYIAIIAAAALAAAWISRLKNERIRIVIVTLIAGALAAKTAQQAQIYRTPITLYRAAVAKNPTSWMLHGNLADELLAAAQVEQAIPEFRETLRLNPNSDDAHYFYSKALEKTGAIDEAIVQLNEVVKLREEHYHFDAYHELAMINLTRGDKPQALAMEEKAKAIVVAHGLEQVAAQSEAWMKASGLK
jgi:hypothetical protein